MNKQQRCVAAQQNKGNGIERACLLRPPMHFNG
jgi:hypothetical protein